MEKYLLVLVVLFSCANKECRWEIDVNFVPDVNTLIGSDSEFAISNGKTHPASNWQGDHGCSFVLPIEDEIKMKEERASWFSHREEITKLNYCKGYFADYDVTTEITSTERPACYGFTLTQSDGCIDIIDGLGREAQIAIISEESKVVGYIRYDSGSVPGDFQNKECLAQ